MTWGCWIHVQLHEAIVDRRCNFLVVLLQEHEVRISLNTNIGKLDPLVVGETHLLEVLDEAVVVGDMGAGLACNHDIRHFVELGEFVNCASLL